LYNPAAAPPVRIPAGQIDSRFDIVKCA